MFGEIENSRFFSLTRIFYTFIWTVIIYLRTLVVLNAILETFPCVYSEMIFTIASFFPKILTKGALE